MGISPDPGEALDFAHCVFQVKSINEEERIIEGLASTPSIDQGGDMMDPAGASFTLPMPLLWQHKRDQPIGQVLSAKVTAAGIWIKAQIAKDPLLPELDRVWGMVRSKLVGGLSVGWIAKDGVRNKSGGFNISKWDWKETSVVTLPMNRETTIALIKSLDAQSLAVSGRSGLGLNVSGASDPTRAPSRSRVSMSKISEKITTLLAEKQAKGVRMSELMQPVIDEGAKLTDPEQTELDGLKSDSALLAKDIENLQAIEGLEAQTARPVIVKTQAEGIAARGATVIEGPKPVPQIKGLGFTRYVGALARSKGNLMQARELAKQWRDSTPDVELVLKSAVDAGSTTDATWAGNLVNYQNLASEFIEFLRALTIIGRVPNLRRVPFNVKLPRQTAGTSGAWVGQGLPKPVGKLAFDTVTLLWAKAATIIVLNDELVRFSNPSAEAIARDDLARGIQEFLDQQFVDPSVTEDANVSPASITNGATTDSASGPSADDFRTDYKAALVSFGVEKISPVGAVFIMQPNQAEALGLMLNPLGQQEFPGISGEGGTIFGKTVITSESVPDGIIVFAKPSEILLADDGGVTIDISTQASLQMDDAPSPGAAQLMSLWQNNLIGIRAERYINWKVRRFRAVYYITAADYGGS